MTQRSKQNLVFLAFAVAVVTGAAAAPAHAVWYIEAIGQAGTLFAPPAFTFDALDRPHVAYSTVSGSSNTVLHSYGVNPHGFQSGWTLPALTPLGNQGPVPILQLAASGNSLYLTSSQVAGAFPSNRAAFYDTGVWQTYGPTGFNGSNIAVTAAAADSTGQVHWVANTTTALLPGTQSPGYYVVKPTGPTSVEATSLYPNLVASTTPLVMPEAVVRLDGDAVFDTAGNLHTIQSYEIGGTGFLLYAAGPAGGPFTVNDNVEPSWWDKAGRPSIALDAAGRPHVAYTQLWPFYGVRHLMLTDQGWVGQTIEDGGDFINGFLGTFPEVLIDPLGRVHVVYADGLHGLLKHASLFGSDWVIETIDTIGTQNNPQTGGLRSVLVGALAAEVDSTGGIGVTYWDADDGWMKYAYLPIPEPATLMLLAGGLGAVAVRRRVRR